MPPSISFEGSMRISRILFDFPSLAGSVPISLPGCRCLIVGLHLIFYVVDRDNMIIVQVIDGRMDVDEEFQR